jgi:hypothetical protein
MLISTWGTNRGIQVLYFTDESNVELIVDRGGLFSWWTLQQRRLPIRHPGGTARSRQLDSERKLHDYVRLCFVWNHPMQYVATREGRIPNPRYIELDPTVLDLPGTLFSDMNACDRDASVGGGLAWFQQNIDRDLIVDGDGGEYTFRNEINMRGPMFGDPKKRWQAEALVPKHVPIQYVK